MSDTNEALREYVTRVGFQLSLTRPQILFLILLSESQAHISTRMISFIPTGRALRAKGLILYGDEDGVRGPCLTSAGEHVVALLSEAGIFQEIAVDGRVAS